jgi:hypothetical protein
LQYRWHQSFFITPRLNNALLNTVTGLSNESKRTQYFDNSEEKESRWEPNPILQIENRFRSDGIRESEIVYLDL